MNKPSDWVVVTQRLGYCPEGWVKHLTQFLVESNPIAGFVHILPSTGLYFIQHLLECRLMSLVLICLHHVRKQKRRYGYYITCVGCIVLHRI